MEQIEQPIYLFPPVKLMIICIFPIYKKRNLTYLKCTTPILTQTQRQRNNPVRMPLSLPSSSSPFLPLLPFIISFSFGVVYFSFGVVANPKNFSKNWPICVPLSLPSLSSPFLPLLPFVVSFNFGVVSFRFGDATNLENFSQNWSLSTGSRVIVGWARFLITNPSK